LSESDTIIIEKQKPKKSPLKDTRIKSKGKRQKDEEKEEDAEGERQNFYFNLIPST